MEISSATNCGLRNENQDAYGYSENIFCIADGHGESGGEIAKKIVEQVVHHDLKAPLHKNILELFEKMNKEIRDEFAGSTVSAAWLKNGKFTVAQLGDSPIFYLKNDKVYHLKGHNTTNPDNLDVDKLWSKGVRFNGPYHFSTGSNWGLQITRTLGDKSLDKNLIRVPDIFEIEAEALAICTDGFTGTAEEVKILFDKGANARQFIKNQENRDVYGIKDNISCIIVYGRKD